MTPRSARTNLKSAIEDLVEQLVEIALEADVARELPREAQALVVDAQLLRDRATPGRTARSPSLRGDLRADRARGVEDVDQVVGGCGTSIAAAVRFLTTQPGVGCPCGAAGMTGAL